MKRHRIEYNASRGYWRGDPVEVIEDQNGAWVRAEDAIAAIEAAYREGWLRGTGRGFNGNDTSSNGNLDWHRSEAKRKAESSDE